MNRFSCKKIMVAKFPRSEPSALSFMGYNAHSDLLTLTKIKGTFGAEECNAGNLGWLNAKPINIVRKKLKSCISADGGHVEHELCCKSKVSHLLEPSVINYHYL